MVDSRAEPRPRVLALDLARLEVGVPALLAPAAWRSADRALDRVGRLSGSALCAAWLCERARARPAAPAPLLIAVGAGVRRALPTAARAAIASRAPLSGLYAEGQVGSDLGPRLAAIADLLVLERHAAPGAVLPAANGAPRAAVLELGLAPDGAARVVLHAIDGLAGLGPRAAAAAIHARLGPCATLCIGPAGEREIPFASLAAGGDPPSFVGRGGLGAVLGGLGLKAIAVSAEAAAPDGAAGARELQRLLASSPRLRARAEGGTLELAEARAAQAEPGGAGSRARAGAFARDARERRTDVHGCRGCPTPCGWVFAGVVEPDGAETRAGARFSALDALGPRLGLARFDDALQLLARCDEAALDAKEMGAALDLWCTARERGRLAGPSPRGDRARLEQGILDCLARRGDGRWLALGARGMAAELGLDAEVAVAKGQAASRERGLAAVLAQCVSARGADPMRVFPFLAAAGLDERRLGALLAPLPVPPGAADPERPAGKGRLVFWHENLSAAIDATGFCAFSAAGLLTDGVCTLDELARRIAPGLEDVLADAPGRAPGELLLAAGAGIALVQRELDLHWGQAPDADRPAWARALCDLPGMWDEYRLLRGLDEAGRPTAGARARIGSAALLELERLAEPEPAPEPVCEPAAEVGRRAPGRVVLRAFGPPARALGPSASFELELPAALREVLGRVAREVPEAGRWLLRGDEPVPAVYRAGRRMEAADLVRSGDELDLVLAIAGGA